MPKKRAAVPTPLKTYADSVGWSGVEIARRAELDPGAVSRFMNGRRPLTRLAAIQIERVMRQAYVDGETDVQPLTREQLMGQANTSTRKAG